MTLPPYVTPKQAQWFKSVRKGLENDTGKTLEEWAEIARSGPESKHQARLAWLKREYGLGINRASTILNAAFETGLGWDRPDSLLDHVWKTPESRAIYDAVNAVVTEFGPDVVAGPRKSFSGFSRKFQFAAMRPTRDEVRLGIAAPLPNTPKYSAPKSSDSWSDRLKTVVLLQNPADIDECVAALLLDAYKTS